MDRKIRLWDLNGAGQKLCIDVGEDEAGSLSNKEKGSVYALAATDNVICSGGPESTVRVWDGRTGKRVTKLVGHTDNIRDVLVSRDGSTILTASSDRSVKVWSTTAGRCMYTLTMHDASVWSLHSSDPDLAVFYSSDKNGLVAKTDTRNTVELDEGLSVAVCQEHEGVHNVRAAGGHLWTATSRPSINRWLDVDTDNTEIEIPENYGMKRSSIATMKRYPGPPSQRDSIGPSHPTGARRKIPLKHMLRLSNAAYFPTPVASETEAAELAPGSRMSMLERPAPELIVPLPARTHPEFSVEGQNGLIKHVMLNDRSRVLTLDTAGEVVMWDLLRCEPIKSFGKRHLEDVKQEVTTPTSVANWCTVDTRTGSVAVVLEENTCFDAEMYADELELDEEIEFREDQRVNLGKWVLRYLFSALITEEAKRDLIYRKRLLHSKEQQKFQRENAPLSIQLPQPEMDGWRLDTSIPHSATTVRPTNGAAKQPSTPGFAIGQATPAAFVSPVKSPVRSANPGALSPTAEEASPFDKYLVAAPRPSTEKTTDYFSAGRSPAPELTSPGGMGAGKAPVTPGTESAPGHADAPTTPTAGDAKDTPSKEGLFGKKFRMNMSFSAGMKKIGRISTNDRDKAAAAEEKEEAESDSRSSETSNSRVVDDNMLGYVQKIRFGYDDSLQAQILSQQAHENGLPVARKSIDLPTAITPSMPAETPVLKPPLNTTILIQEDRPEAGGVADLFEGTVGALGEMCDLVERAAPTWLADVLFRNQIPHKDVVKISFVLEPVVGSGLPGIASDGNNRLNANRMLRAKKILAYVAERIEPGDPEEMAEEGELRPEEYLELWCQGQVSCASAAFCEARRQPCSLFLEVGVAIHAEHR